MSQVDQLVLREIENQMSMDTPLLLRMLGTAQSVGASPGTANDGKVILENVRRTVRERMCSDRAVRSAHRATGNSKVVLIAAVADCIAGAITGVSPITVAVLLVREGLEVVCKEIWSVES